MNRPFSPIKARSLQAVGDASGPRPCATRRANLRCLALPAAVAIASGGCTTEIPPAPYSQCRNSATGEIVKVLGGRGNTAILRDRQGYDFIVDLKKHPEWRCTRVVQ